MSINKPSHLKKIFQERNIRAKKKLGQNFLFDQNILHEVVETARVDANSIVLEIGTGCGSLTRVLAETAKHVVTVEIDTSLHELINDELGSIGNLITYFGDILEKKSRINGDVVKIISTLLNDNPDSNFKVVSNFPYAVATPVIVNFLEGFPEIISISGIVQYEHGARMVAQPNSSDYSSLSVIVQTASKAKMIRKLGKQLFWPPPKVHSGIIHLDVLRPYDRPYKDSRDFFHFVRNLFSSRRKTLRNALKLVKGDNFTESILENFKQEENLPAICRAENLSPEQIVRLYHLVK